MPDGLFLAFSFFVGVRDVDLDDACDVLFGELDEQKEYREREADQRESSEEVRLDAGLLFAVGNVGEDAERRKGGRKEVEGEEAVALVEIGANRGLNGVEEEDVEIDESEGEGVGGGGRSVALRPAGPLGRRERGGIVVAQGSGMV